MKRNFKYIYFGIFCFAILMLLFLIISNNVTKSLKENKYISPIEYYVLSEYQGKIAVFKNGENIPINVFDTYISALPQHDRKLIENGIQVQTKEELQSLIEDYTS